MMFVIVGGVFIGLIVWLLLAPIAAKHTPPFPGAPAGWYVDRSTRKPRYWDGRQWVKST